jgi:hypothetical protein
MVRPNAQERGQRPMDAFFFGSLFDVVPQKESD